jgi:uncharacterized BrkB/YihY/UPF0761 family membrane protein
MPSWLRIIIIVFLSALAIFLGIYVGIYLMFIGGIVQIIDAVQATPVEGAGIAWGVLRIVFAGAAGWLSFILGFVLAGLFGVATD